MRPIQAFLQTQTSGSVLLLAAAIVAIIWANSPWDEQYFDLWGIDFSADLNLFRLDFDLHMVVNDGLMAIFFFVVGLEIKRELLHGELASFRRAALPVMAALGGMAVPALLYTVFNAGGDGARGWGIPMATDIAFAVGVLSLLGRRAPFSLKVLLLALAIVDDLGAIIVIALFYTESMSFEALGIAVALIGVILAFRRAGVQSTDLYVVLGVLFWMAVFKSGIHATIAGVVLAMLTPAGPRYARDQFEAAAAALTERFRAARAIADHDGEQAAMSEFERLARGSESPLERLERSLSPWVSFLIVPVFALANAGVVVGGDALRGAAESSVTHGVMVGLILGKPVGIVLFSALAVRLGLASLPGGVTYLHMLGMGMIGGIGFTVSLFISGLAFTSPDIVDQAKIGILAASTISGIIGFLFLFLLPAKAEQPVEVRLEPGR